MRNDRSKFSDWPNGNLIIMMLVLVIVLASMALASCTDTPIIVTITPTPTEVLVTPQPTHPPVEQVVVIEAESFKCVKYYNSKGYPVLDTCVVGWKSEVNVVYEAYVQPEIADGGSLWWRLYRGPDNYSFLDVEGCSACDEGVFIKKDNTKLW